MFKILNLWDKLSIGLLFADFWTINSRKTNCSLSSLCDQEKALCLIVILKLTRWCLQENCKDKTLNVLLAEQPKENESIGSLPATDVYASAFCFWRSFAHAKWHTSPQRYQIQLVHISLTQQNKNMYYTFFPILQVHRNHIFATCTIQHKKQANVWDPYTVRPMDPMRIWKKHLKFSVSPSHLDGVAGTSSRIPGVVGGR